MMTTKLSAFSPAYIPLSSEAGGPMTVGGASPCLDLPVGATLRMTAALELEHPSDSDSQKKWTKIPKKSQFQDHRCVPQHQAPLQDPQCTNQVASMLANLTLAQAYAWPMQAGNVTGWTPPCRKPSSAMPIVERPKRQLQNQRRRRCCLQIATHLNCLEDKNPACVLFARQISKLGFDSAEILKAHFEKYGPVETVLLSNSHSKSGSVTFPVRVRPSGMGFVVMQHPDGTARALAQGETHLVHGIEIKVRAFKKRTGVDTDDEPGHVGDELADLTTNVDSQDVDFTDLPALRLLRDQLHAEAG